MFALPSAGAIELTGHARVLREQAHHVYALRFERLLDPVRAALDELVGTQALGHASRAATSAACSGPAAGAIRTRRPAPWGSAITSVGPARGADGWRATRWARAGRRPRRGSTTT